MSADGNDDHVYVIPVEDLTDATDYHTHIHTHTPFSPPPPPESGDGKRMFVSYEEILGRKPGTTTCTSCQQQVTTNVTYKTGKFAWLLVVFFICLGLLTCMAGMLLLPIPFCVKKVKDAYHTCPLCNRVLHVDKKKCCD